MWIFLFPYNLHKWELGIFSSGGESADEVKAEGVVLFFQYLRNNVIRNNAI